MPEKVVLVIDFDCATCSFCGLGAGANDDKHTKILEMGCVRSPQKGERACGKRFTHTASSAASTRMAAGIKTQHPSLEFLGSGEVVRVGIGVECAFRLATPAGKFKSR